MRKILLLLRQLVCTHRVSAGRIKRLSPDLVECPCNLCGKVLSAPYGIALEAAGWDHPDWKPGK